MLTARTAASQPHPARQSVPGRLTVVYATAYPPAGQRRRWLIVTDPCPLDGCGGGRHVHAAADLSTAGGVRRAGCRRGTYWVAVGGPPDVGGNGHG